jgi:hypothetical protein
MDLKNTLRNRVPINSSPQLLYQYISTHLVCRSGFDNVNSRGEFYFYLE